MKRKENGLAIRLVAFLSVCLLSSAWGIDNGLVKTPPMGWNSWNVFHENINETQIKQIADVMVSSGMRDAGYIYLNLDDNWMATSRDANGDLRADPTRFPSGMKSLGDYIHSKGLKFGVYGDRGNRTCYHYNGNISNTKSGSYGNETRDAKIFASWGVDYLKYDNCDPATGSNQQKDYENMRDALAQSGRPIVYSICAWGYQSWMPATGNLWRTTGDISNSWETATGGFFQGVTNIIDLNEKYAPQAAPGGWNDPDMLQIGNGVLTSDESRAHMSLWAMMAAPLITGNDIRTMSQATKDILLNKDVIAINQDSAGYQGKRIRAANGLEIWSKTLGSLTSNTKAVALLNRSASTASMTINFSDIGLTGEVQVRDLWANTDKGKFTTSYTMSVPSHGTGLLKISIPAIVTVPQAPFAGIITLPDTIQAENYDVGGEGVSYHDSDPTNLGNVYRNDGVDITGDSASGYKVGWTVAGEWLEYTISVATAGTYTWIARASTGSDSAAFHMEVDSVDISGHIQVASTGTWDDFKEFTGTTTIPLTAGTHVLRITIDRSYLNLDWISFARVLPTSLILRSVFSNQDGNYEIFDLHGQLLGIVSGRSDQELRNSIWKMKHRTGLYFAKSLSGSQMQIKTMFIKN